MSSQWKNPYAETAFSKDPTDKTQKRIEDSEHLRFVKQLPSLVSGEQPCDPCHVRYGDPKHRKRKTPTRRKPDDMWVVPMTRAEHDCQHGMNEQAFWEQIGIDPLEVAYQLYRVSGNIEAGRTIILKARRAAQ